MKKEKYIILTMFLIFSLFMISGCSSYKNPWAMGQKGEISLCEKYFIDNKYDKLDVCYTTVAIYTANIEICDKIHDETLKSSCYSNMAGILKDPSICESDKIKGSKDMCYFGLGLETKDDSYCDKIQYNHAKTMCFKRIQQNWTVKTSFEIAARSDI